MSTKILCVDDDFNILQAYKRILHAEFSIETAYRALDGLEAIRTKGPFPVVVSDLRMPEMDGIRFLVEVRKCAPETVRILLTGQADLNTGVAAVNEGNIFRFLTKPCSPEALAKALRAGVEQYHLITAEKVLLKRTLVGAVQVLTETLGLVNPVAFSRASRIKRYVREMAAQLNRGDVWQFELAAMLSQIGCVTMPPDLLNKAYAGQAMTDDEQKMFADHPKIAGGLLAKIPRLESVARIVECQHKLLSLDRIPKDESHPDYQVFLGAQLLKAALDFDQLVTAGVSPSSAVATLRGRGENFLPGLLDALEKLELEIADRIIKTVAVREITPLMILDEDIRSKNGSMLLAKGHQLTPSLVERLHNFIETAGVVEPIRVTVPRQDDQLTPAQDGAVPL